MDIQQAEKLNPDRSNLRRVRARFPDNKLTRLFHVNQYAEQNGGYMTENQLQPNGIAVLMQGDAPKTCFCQDCNSIFTPEWDKLPHSKSGIPDPMRIPCPECSKQPGYQLPKIGYLVKGETKDNGEFDYHIPTAWLGGFTFDYQNPETGDTEMTDISIVTQDTVINEKDGKYTPSWTATEQTTRIEYDRHDITIHTRKADKLNDDGTLAWEQANPLVYINDRQVKRQYIEYIPDGDHIDAFDPLKCQKSSLYFAGNIYSEDLAQLHATIIPKNKHVTHLLSQGATPVYADYKKTMKAYATQKEEGDLFETHIPYVTVLTDKAIDSFLRNERETRRYETNPRNIDWDRNDVIERMYNTRYSMDDAIVKSMDTRAFMLWEHANVEHIRETLMHDLKNKGIDPAYLDWNNNIKWSFDENTIVKNKGRRCFERMAHPYNMADIYLNFVIRYPAAFEYACDLCDKEIENRIYAKYRNESKEMPKDPDERKKVLDEERKNFDYDTKVNLFNQTTYKIMNQLVKCDNKILTAIQNSRNMDEMMRQLQFFAFGDSTGTKKMPIENTILPESINTNNMVLDSNGNMKNNEGATNVLIAKFRENPIVTAHNNYTLHKFGITSNDIKIKYMDNNKMLALKPQKRVIGFLKQWINNHNADTKLDKDTNERVRDTYAGQRHVAEQIMGKKTEDNDYTGGWDDYILTDAIKMYAKLKTNPNIHVALDSRDKSARLQRNTLKENLMQYLINGKTVQQAYGDYAEIISNKLGLKLGDTPEENKTAAEAIKNAIDETVDEIDRDYKLDQIKSLYEKSGKNLESVISNPNINAIISDYASTDEDKKALLDGYIPTNERDVFVETTDSKPLFNNRTAKNLHDELQLLTKKTGSNEKISYKPEERSELEGEFVIDESEPNIKCKIRLLNDTFDFVKTSNDLHNCVASSSDYFKNAQNPNPNKRHYIMCMEMPDKSRTACIELHRNPHHGEVNEPEYYIDQLQGIHDSKLNATYAKAMTDWMNKINAAPCPESGQAKSEVGVFCEYDKTQQKYIAKQDYIVDVDNNINYDRNSWDDVTNMVTNKATLEERRNNRAAIAQKIYGGNLPESPARMAHIFDFDIKQIIEETPEQNQNQNQNSYYDNSLDCSYSDDFDDDY